MRLLHISDIHFKHPLCQTEQDPELYFRKELVSHATQQTSRLGDVDAIVVTGDVAFKGVQEEFEAAETWLEKLADQVGCNKRRIYVVPGNHDVDRSRFDKDGSVRNAVAAIANAGNNEAREKELIAQLEASGDRLFATGANFNQFAAKYDCQFYPGRLRWSTVLRIDYRTVVRLHGLNSTLISGIGGTDHKGNLFMGALQLNISQAPGTANLVMAHHPPEWMSDQDDIETRLLSAPNIVLFGHRHIQKVRRDVGGPIVVSAGSVNPDRSESGWEPAYNFLELSPADRNSKRYVDVTVFQFHWQSNPNGFVPKYNFDTREYCFRHAIAVEGESEASDTEVLVAQNEKGKEEAEPMEMENDNPSLATPNVRDLIYRFWNLPRYHQRATLRALGINLSAIRDVNEPMTYRKALVELAKQNRLNQLAAAIGERESAS